MNELKNDFRNYATKHMGISSMNLHRYEKELQKNSNFTSNYISPTIIEERQLNIVSMDVFSRLQMDRVIFLGTGIDDYVSNVITAQLLYLQSTDSSRDITMYINSGGGEIYSGYSVLDTMNYISPDVSTICTGMAASMAAILLSSGAKTKRCALPHSRIMIHQPLGGAQGQASDIEIRATQIKMLKKELYDILSTNTNQPFEKIEKDSDRDYWMTSQEAKDYGMIDEILINNK